MLIHWIQHSHLDTHLFIKGRISPYIQIKRYYRTRSLLSPWVFSTLTLTLTGTTSPLLAPDHYWFSTLYSGNNGRKPPLSCYSGGFSLPPHPHYPLTRDPPSYR